MSKSMTKAISVSVLSMMSLFLTVSRGMVSLPFMMNSSLSMPSSVSRVN